MLSGAVCWNVLEEQLAHSKTSSDKIRNKIFEFALSQGAHLRRSGSHGEQPLRTEGLPPNHTSMENRVWISGTSMGPDSEDQGRGNEVELVTVRTCHHSWLNTKKSREGSHLHWETVSTLGAVIDLSTHLSNYPTPLATPLTRFVVAEEDLYIPRQHISPAQDVWPGTLPSPHNPLE